MKCPAAGTIEHSVRQLGEQIFAAGKTQGQNAGSHRLRNQQFEGFVFQLKTILPAKFNNLPMDRSYVLLS